MATFDCVIDTSQMASSLDSVSGHLVTTTAAVTAMQAAVIKSERDAANKICRNVDRGFFSLIRSQISTKLAAHITTMNAKIALLMQFSKSLSATRKRMENDYVRLKREYYKIFHGLDKSLENRIYEIDKPAMRLAAMRDNLIKGKILRDTANTFYYSRDTHRVSQLAFTARIKNKASKSIDRMADNVFENQKYKSQLDTLLEHGNNGQRQEEYVPAICVEEYSAVGSGAVVNQIYHSGFFPSSVQGMVETGILNYMDAILDIQKSDFERNEIYREFMNLVYASNMDERTKQTALRLFQNGGI